MPQGMLSGYICTKTVLPASPVPLCPTIQVLNEIRDIIDLPDRAEMVLGLLEKPDNLLPAFEALTVLEATAENAKAAWARYGSA